MNVPHTYYLLKKNNSLQTFEKLIHPYVYASLVKADTQVKKRKLELHYLRELPIHSHFDHLEKNCDEEIIAFDEYLLTKYGFSFLTKGFDHTMKQLRGRIQYDKKFPATLSDEQLLTIQMRMDKYHFYLVEQAANNKAVILLNPWPYINPVRDGEILKYENFFDTDKEARDFANLIIETHFELNGSILTIGPVTIHDITERTLAILKVQNAIRYKTDREDMGERFIATKNLVDIKEYLPILIDLYDSVGKNPYQIIVLK